MKELRYGDVGVDIILTVVDQDSAAVDVSAASTLEIIFNTPAITTLTKTASLVNDGSDGKIKYATVSGFATIEGIWEAQAYVVIGSNQYTSTILKFRVTRKIT